MATSTVTTCDFVDPNMGEAHGVPATTQLRASLYGKTYEADLCDACVEKVERALTRLGVRPSVAVVGGKLRGAYVTASGKSFTTAEAREWLLTHGHAVNPSGRISKELLFKYAQDH